MRVSLPIAAALAFGVSTAAFADGYQPRSSGHAPFSWTGFYVGVEGGGGWGSEHWVDNSGLPSANVHHDPSGGILGGQAGYRLQAGQFVFGIEGSAAWADVNDTVRAGTVSETFKVESLYTATGQLGFAVDRWLVYAKGGWAGGSTHLGWSNTAFPATASHSENNNGWVVGAGLDYAISKNVILGVEYDHVDLGYSNFVAPVSNGGVPLAITNASRLTTDAVLARLSFKFGERDDYRPLK